MIRLYDMCGKLLKGLICIYDIILVCIRVDGCKSECLGDGWVRQSLILFRWLFNVHMGAVMKKWKMRIGRMGAKFLEEGGEWRLPGLVWR